MYTALGGVLSKMDKKVIHSIVIIFEFLFACLIEVALIKSEIGIPFIDDEYMRQKLFYAVIPTVLIFNIIFEIILGYSKTLPFINDIPTKKLKIIYIILNIVLWVIIMYIIFFYNIL